MGLEVLYPTKFRHYDQMPPSPTETSSSTDTATTAVINHLGYEIDVNPWQTIEFYYPFPKSKAVS